MASSSSRTSLPGLEGKVAVITASTDGMGLAMARRLGREGCRVMVSSRTEANVQRAVDTLKAEGLDVAGVVCHVGKAEDRKRLVDETMKKWGGIDIFVQNAAVNPAFGLGLNVTEEMWDKIFDVNVKASFLLAQMMIPIMEQRGKGSIVFVSSASAYDVSMGAYSVSKTALLGLTKMLSRLCSGKNIRVNCVAPGLIDTSFATKLTSSQTIMERHIAQLHIKRAGVPEDISGLVAFLSSDDAAYITGETIIASGGHPGRL